jgi:hypothetical protein
MSGHKVVPILDANKDVYLHGGPVRRVKAGPSKSKAPTDVETEIVVAAACSMKLLQRARPAAVRSAKSATATDGPASHPAAQASVLATEEQPKEPPTPKPMLVWRQLHCFVKDVVPLRSVYSDSPSAAYGFAMLFFSTKRTPKDPEKVTPFCRDLFAQCKCIEPSALGLFPQLRVREYACSSEYEQEDWVSVFRMALTNYWHERLESVIVAAPEVFQWQSFCLELADLGSCSLAQAVLSTVKLYVVPRHDQQHLEKDSVKHKSVVVSTLTRIQIQKDSGTVELTATGCGFTVLLGFFSPREAVIFVLELQRIWELGSKTEAFPYE